ncbi:MAG: hypothetical protein OXT03_06295 [Alphaproteobacteria bacterium]|nr:hypothetical protein [Alphaproteobacteria bacterium]
MSRLCQIIETIYEISPVISPMLRSINFILIAIIIILLTALYHIRYSADAEIKAINKATSTIRDEQLKQQVLQAEWASLNNPQRLEQFANQYLDLVPARAGQLHAFETFITQEKKLAQREAAR